MKQAGKINYPRFYLFSELSLIENYEAQYITLHVRKSNIGALNLYEKQLGFIVMGIDAKYYADGEDAYSMRKNIAP